MKRQLLTTPCLLLLPTAVLAQAPVLTGQAPYCSYPGPSGARQP